MEMVGTQAEVVESAQADEGVEFGRGLATHSLKQLLKEYDINMCNILSDAVYS